MADSCSYQNIHRPSAICRHVTLRGMISGLLLVVLPLLMHAQEVNPTIAADTITADTQKMAKVKKSSIFSGKPGKAMIMSLIVPGTGQLYNKSYIRVPIVWGAVGGMGYLLHYNTQQYNCLKDAYKASIDGEPYTFPKHCSSYEGITNPNQLKLLRDEANEARQLSIVGFTLVWIANGIDAFVNAHLKEFDVNENLSIDIGSRYGDDPYSPMRVGLFVHF